MVSRREFFKGIAAGLAVAAMPKAVRAAAILPRAEVCFYEVAGHTIFPLYGNSGGLVSTALCLPFIKQADGSMIVYRHDETMQERYSTGMPGDIEAMHKRALRCFDEAYTSKLSSSRAIESFEDGCEFPQAGEIVRIVPRRMKEKQNAA